MAWLSYFLSSFLLSLFLSGGIFWLKNKLGVPCSFRWGGLAMIVAFILSVLFNPEIVLTRAIGILLLALLGVLVFGFWDDWKNFSWRKQLTFQIFLALLFLIGGFGIGHLTFPWGAVWAVPGFLAGAFFSFWMILLINSVNWLDGRDGLLGILSFFGAASIFLVSLRAEVNQPALAILSILFLSSVLGFWVFNFPPAKLEAGTSGSYFVGVVLVGLAFLSGTKIATTLLILILPIMDALRVVGERWQEKKSIFSREERQRHLHYLLGEIGWTEKKIILAYAVFWFLALWPELFLKSRGDKFFWLLGEVGVLILFFFWVKKRQRQLQMQKNRP